MKTVNIAVINEVSLQVVVNDKEQLIPIKPVCDILGVSYSAQFEKLKEHPIFASTIRINRTVGADGKEREMACIPLRYFSSWIFSIHPDKVKDEIRESIIEFQRKCNDILYDYFFNRADFALKKEVAIAKAKEVFDEKTELVRLAKSEQRVAETDYKKALNLTFEQYEAERSQLKLPGFE